MTPKSPSPSLTGSAAAFVAAAVLAGAATCAAVLPALAGRTGGAPPLLALALAAAAGALLACGFRLRAEAKATDHSDLPQ